MVQSGELFSSYSGSSTVIFDRLALMLMWKPMGRIRCLAACSTPSAIAPGQSKSTVLLSAKVSAQSELGDVFGFFRLAVADENGHDLFFFPKAFEPILRHVLHDKMTPLNLVICFVKC